MSNNPPIVIRDLAAIARFIAVLVMILSVMVSCKKEKSDTEHLYFIESQILKSISASQTKIFLSQLLSAYPEGKPLLDNTAYDVEVYKITYRTTFKENDIRASGIVCLPRANASFPLLSFQNGTNTELKKAPSVDLFDPLYSLLQSLSGNGYIMVMADYIGFGESVSVLHPYYHRQSSNKAVVDLIRACNEFLEGRIGASANGQLFIMGYSQGGWATLSLLHELESNHPLPGLVTSASCGAGAYNITNMAQYIMALPRYPSPFYLPYFIESHIRNGYLNEPLQKYFNEPYASIIPGLFNGILSGGAINRQLTDSVNQLLTPGLRQNFDTGEEFSSLRNELNLNSIGAWASGTKLMFIHGTADKNVPVSESEYIYEAFIQAGLSGEQVKIVLLDGLTHDTALLPWGIKSMLWFNEMKD